MYRVGALFVAFAIVGIASSASPGTLKYELKDYDPVASSKAVVTSKNARFTVLTPSIVRIQWTDGDDFEDRPTLSVVNRKLDVPDFTSNSKDGKLTITTAAFTLTYTEGKEFSASTLSVKTNNQSSAFQSWSYGMTSDADPGNLLGTFRTLDGRTNDDLNCTVNQQPHCVYGLISTSGWALYNDTDTPLLDSDDWWTDSDKNPYSRVDSEDLYLFVHGHNYRNALYEYSLIGGNIPVTPRYISGIWFTRWYNYNAIDTRKVVEDYTSRSIPLDVWVYDMNWHTKDAWTGFSTDPALFPYEEDNYAWIKNQGLALSANIHDAQGINNWEAAFDEFCKAIGVDPSNTTTVDFDLSDKTFVMALEDVILKRLEDMGYDMWWIDWQQGEDGYGTKGGKMNPTIWTDKMRVTDPKRRAVQSGIDATDIKRGVVFARWGGLGNHRYQVGFSGDVNGLTWSNLAYQPYFSATASNVLYGFWSHDIVGPGDDPELYVRWVQWGSLSSVMRSHDRGLSSGGCYGFPTVEGTCPIVEPFNVPRKFFEANRAALQARSALIPYLYTYVRLAYETGVSLVHPLYYDFPEDDMAYASNNNGDFAEYMLGDDLLVAPVVTQSDNTTMANSTFYLPEGVWVERHSGTEYHIGSGGKVISKYFDLTETPIYVRGGAVIPERPCCKKLLGGAMAQYDELTFNIFPGADSGSGRVYEDDAATTAYLSGNYAWTTASYKREQSDAGETLTVSVKTEGSGYADLPSQRGVTIKVVNSPLPSKVSVGGKQLTHSRFGGDLTWSYDGNEMTLVVEVGTVKTSDDTTVTITTDSELATTDGPSALSGMRGVVTHAVLSKRNLDEVRATPGSSSGKVGPAELARLAMFGEGLSLMASNASAWHAHFDNFTAVVKAAVSELAELNPPPTALLQLYKATRHDHCLCGSEDCRSTNSDYSTVRIEGYLASESTPGSVALNLYWDGKHDNFVTTNNTVPTGYTRGNFKNGYVLSANDDRRGSAVPLSLYVNKDTGDHMTVATPEGRADAKAGGYDLVNATIGHVFTEPQLTALGDVDANRLDYSVVLINTAVQQLPKSRGEFELAMRVREVGAMRAAERVAVSAKAVRPKGSALMAEA